MVSHDELFALRVTLQDEYTDEADIIRQLKSYLLQSMALEEIDQYLHEFYNSFGINIPIEELRDVRLDRRFVRRIQRNNLSTFRNITGPFQVDNQEDLNINTNVNNQTNNNLEESIESRLDISSNNQTNLPTENSQFSDNQLEQILDNVLDNMDYDIESEEDVDSENEDDEENNFGQDYDQTHYYNDLPDLIDPNEVNNNNYINSNSWPNIYNSINNNIFSNIVSNSGFTSNQLQDPNIHDAMNILLQNLESQYNEQSQTNDQSQANDQSQNVTNNTNYNHSRTFQNSNGLLNLVRFGQGLQPIEENNQNNNLDSSSIDDSNSSSDNNESTETTNQNMNSFEDNQNLSTDQILDQLPDQGLNHNQYDYLLQRLYNTHSANTPNIGEQMDISNNLVHDDTYNQTEDHLIDNSQNNQTLLNNYRSGIRRRMNAGPLPANRRRRNTLSQSQIFSQLISTSMFPRQMAGMFSNLPMNQPPIHMEDVRVTLQDNELESIRTIKFSEINDPKIDEKKCTICMTKFADDDDISILKCNHIFHEDCIKEWLKEYNYRCPVCRCETGTAKYDL